MLNIMERLTTMAFFVVAGCLAVTIFFALLFASNLLGEMALTAFTVGG
jgi:hypothetical protein